MSRPALTAQFHQNSRSLNGKYLLGDEIGKGAYGRVYKGLDMENGDFVAIKQVSLENIFPEDLASIMQEIDLLKNLNHKNIVKYLGSIKTRSHLYIVLEYVENGSLASIIKPKKFGAIPESLVAFYISQVLEGLVYLHEQGVIHRDIKGANILTTKEGLVKLADFGVATKLTEADNNTDSVVGTPYWMAPEVIVMSGVSAASDIWSMGCTVIELLTCVPPYYDLQPMTALYRIVEEDHPPIPEHLSPLVTDFLHQCFRKDAKLRPDAKTLLEHSWIQNFRRAPYSSLSDGKLKHSAHDVQLNIQKIAEDGAACEDVTGGSASDDDKGMASSPVKASEAELSSNQNLTIGRSIPIRISRKFAEQLVSNKDGPSVAGSEDKASPDKTVNMNDVTSSTRVYMAEKDLTRTVITSDGQQRQTLEKVTNGISEHIPDQESRKFSGVVSAEELNRFRDTPADGMLDDLFDNSPGKMAIPASTEAATADSTFYFNQASIQNGNGSLAATLKAKIAQRKDLGEVSSSVNKTNTFLTMAASGEEIDPGMTDLMTTRTQAVEIIRLINLLKPEESEDSIIKTCQRLISILRDNPDQKIHLISQHGVIPFMDMLEIKNNRVVHAVLQVINQLAKDNPNFQENACLVGLVPIIMNFTGPECSRDLRMQAAYFVRQLCQTSISTLQMFIACRGLPVLVNFLEADYAKYREMVHTAIDGMWQVFNLQSPTPRNDFCRIFSKNGVLIRLVNTLHSLNEATRLASTIGSGTEINNPQTRSGLLETSHAMSGQMETLHPRSGQLDVSYPHGHLATDPLRAGIPLKGSAIQIESKQTPAQLDANAAFPNLFEQVATDNGWSSSGHQGKPPLFRVDRENFDLGPLDLGPLDGDQTRPLLGIADNVKQPQEQSWVPLDVAQGRGNGQLESLVSLLEKDPSSRPVSGQLEYIRHLQGLERHDSILPLLHHTSAIRKNNGELNLLMSAFDDNGKDANLIELAQSNLGLKLSTNSSRGVAQGLGGCSGICDTAVPVSGLVSQSASGFLSVSGVLNGRPTSVTSSGLMSHMASTLNADVAREYLEKVADLLLEFSRGDSVVKSHMCGLSLLIRLFQMLNRLEMPILFKALMCIKELSSDPSTLEHLQRADAMKHLVPFLEWREGPFVAQVHNEVLNALYNLCKINKRRMERAAENGIIPHLMHFVKMNSPLKRFALPLLCDMAHASRYTREQLRSNKGIELYLSLLDDEDWTVTALDSLAVCLASDNEQKKVEHTLLKAEAIQKLVSFFQSCSEQSFVHILEPFLKIITKSSRINISLATSGFIPLLVARLDHQDAIARLNLLKMIKAIYEHHAQPKQLIVEYDLQQKLQRLIEERRDGEHSGGQVLVKQMATSLLKALHFNCVL